MAGGPATQRDEEDQCAHPRSHRGAGVGRRRVRCRRHEGREDPRRRTEWLGSGGGSEASASTQGPAPCSRRFATHGACCPLGDVNGGMTPCPRMPQQRRREVRAANHAANRTPAACSGLRRARLGVRSGPDHRTWAQFRRGLVSSLPRTRPQVDVRPHGVMVHRMPKITRQHNVRGSIPYPRSRTPVTGKSGVPLSHTPWSTTTSD